MKIQTLQLAGKLVHFLGSWEKLTKDQNIFQVNKDIESHAFAGQNKKENQRK